MSREKKDTVPIRNVRLKTKTYERLEKFKVELIQQKGKPQVTFDDAINYLLDEHHSLSGNVAHANVKKT